MIFAREEAFQLRVEQWRWPKCLLSSVFYICLSVCQRQRIPKIRTLLCLVDIKKRSFVRSKGTKCAFVLIQKVRLSCVPSQSISGNILNRLVVWRHTGYYADIYIYIYIIYIYPNSTGKMTDYAIDHGEKKIEHRDDWVLGFKGKNKSKHKIHIKIHSNPHSNFYIQKLYKNITLVTY